MSTASFLRRQQALLNYRPIIVGSLVGTASVTAQVDSAKSANIDLLEVRLDTFREIYRSGAASFTGQLLKQVIRSSKVPILATIRSPKEGGGLPKLRPLSSAQKQPLFRSAIDHARVVDVEIRDSLAARITHWAHTNRVDVVHSFHDFSGISSSRFIGRLSQLSAWMKGDVFKVAVKVRSVAQVRALLDLCLSIQKPLPAFIAMGNEGLVSRFIGFSFGSVLTFGHLGQSAAPGQLPAFELSRAIRRLYPSSRGRHEN